jgi:hypothetical protein
MCALALHLELTNYCRDYYCRDYYCRDTASQWQETGSRLTLGAQVDVVVAATAGNGTVIFFSA